MERKDPCNNALCHLVNQKMLILCHQVDILLYATVTGSLYLLAKMKIIFKTPHFIKHNSTHKKTSRMKNQPETKV